jgi:molecular chaperone HtpG
VINAPWFDSAADKEAIELELESCFGETPLDIIPIRIEKPASIVGALYISPQRVPGFSDSATVMVTVRRMVISRRIRDLLPEWATFVRGVLELHNCSPTASREDLVRNAAFDSVRKALLDRLYEYLEQLAANEPDRMQAILNWHRYTFAGAALNDRRLRDLIRKIYSLPTSAGPLTIDQILERSPADPLFETEADRVVWYNMDRRQERWINQLFAEHDVPCVHAFRSFEESLLAAIVADERESGSMTALRMASASATNFAEGILGIRDMEPVDASWDEFLSASGAKLFVASFSSRQPVMAFLNERYELARTFDDLKKEGQIPPGFQRLIDSHFASEPAGTNEVVLNRNHPVVKRSLSQRTGTPISSVLRLLVTQALNSAGATIDDSAQRQQMDDLDWIAEALWGRDD